MTEGARTGLVDCLCHLELGEYRELNAGLAALIAAGTDPRVDDVTPSLTTAIHRAYGIHPERADDAALTDQLAALEAKLDSAVAIGECGLDARPGLPPLDVQERTFRAQLEVARRRKLPVILHLVRTHTRALAILAEGLDEGGPLAGMWHAFSGPKEVIDPAVKLGLYCSVGALVLNPTARRLHEALPHIPRDRLLVETDSPHVAATVLTDIVVAVAKVRGESYDDVATATVNNARRLFRL